MAAENLKKMASAILELESSIADAVKDGKVQVFEGVEIGAVVVKALGSGIKLKALKSELKLSKKDRDDLVNYIAGLNPAYQDNAVLITKQLVKLAGAIVDTIELIRSL